MAEQWAYGNRSILGGLVGAWLGVHVAKRLCGYRLRTGDLFAPAVALGMAVGRIGCLLTELPGTPTGARGGSASTAWTQPGWASCRRAAAPSFAYEIAFHLAAFAVIWFWLRHRSLPPGEIFVWYVAAYGVFRFLVEFVRGNEVVWDGPDPPPAVPRRDDPAGAAADRPACAVRGLQSCRPRSTTRGEGAPVTHLARGTHGAGMPLRGDRIHRYVNAFCPLCHEEAPDRPLAEVQRLSGWLVEREDRIWLERGCATHGLVRTLYDESPEILTYLEQWTAPTKVHTPDVAGNFAPVPAAYADGLPEMQTQHTCILLEDLLDHCNLKCPTCFAASAPALASVVPLEQVLASIDARLSRENGRIDVLMLSGGEPTLYPRLAELLDAVAQAARSCGCW